MNQYESTIAPDQQMLNLPTARRSALSRRPPEKYDSTTGHWSPVATMKTSVVVHRAGAVSSGASASASTGSWHTRISTMSSARRNPREVIAGDFRMSPRRTAPERKAAGV